MSKITPMPTHEQRVANLERMLLSITKDFISDPTVATLKRMISLATDYRFERKLHDDRASRRNSRINMTINTLIAHLTDKLK